MRASAFAVVAAIALAAPPALAEEDPNGRGVVGGALLGAELTVLVEAAVGVEPVWAYFAGGALGAGAGAYAGSVVEEQAEREVSLILLAAGVGLVIPTAVLVGNWTQPRAPPSDQVRLLPPRVRVGLERAPSATIDVVRGQF